MKKFFFVILSLVLIIGPGKSFDFNETELESDEKLWELYERWSIHHAVSRSADEQQERFSVFKAKAHYVNNFNKMDEPYKLGLNKFSDMTNEEFMSLYSWESKPDDEQMIIEEQTNVTTFEYKYNDIKKAPYYFDWRQYGAVTAVRDQKDCGSCWAFATVSTVESINYIKRGRLISLSEQELMDCDRGKSAGCKGGYFRQGFTFIRNNGITTRNNYPYTAKDGVCDWQKARAPAVRIDGRVDIPANNEIAMLVAVSRQPIAAQIDARGNNFADYKEGVFTGSCGTNHNHVITIVGYGTTAKGIDYWIVKNSWGPDWGENGYIRMKRGVYGQGLCGIAMTASYPVVRNYIEEENEGFLYDA